MAGRDWDEAEQAGTAAGKPAKAGSDAVDASSPPEGTAAGSMHESVNEVHLIGRLGSAAQERTLPSGDVVLTFHVVVDRPLGIRGTGRPRKQAGGVDALACAAWAARARRTVRTLPAGTWVDVEGSLRRRFRRGGSTPTSFYEVEVVRIRRLR